MTLPPLVLPVTIVFAGLANLALVWGLGRAMAAPDYAAFSLWLTAAQFVAVASFDWQRIMVIRHLRSPGFPAAAMARSRAGLALALLAAGAVAALLGRSAVPLALAAYAVAQGFFEIGQARHRAEARILGFIAQSFARTLATLAVVGWAWFWAPGVAAALAAMAAAFALPALFARPRRHGSTVSEPAAPAIGALSMRQMLRAGLAMSSTGLLYHGGNAALRAGLLLALPDVSRAAALILTLDLCQRGFLALGTAANLVFQQQAIETVQRGGKGALHGAANLHLLRISALLGPAVALVWVLRQPLSLLLPAAYRAAFSQNLLLVAGAAALLALRAFGTDTAALLAGREAVALRGALAAPAVALASLLPLWALLPPGQAILWCALSGGVGGLLASGLGLRGVIGMRH